MSGSDTDTRFLFFGSNAEDARTYCGAGVNSSILLTADLERAWQDAHVRCDVLFRSNPYPLPQKPIVMVFEVPSGLRPVQDMGRFGGIYHLAFGQRPIFCLQKEFMQDSRDIVGAESKSQ